jgi:aconitate hydratase
VSDLQNGEAKTVTVTARGEGGDPIEFEARVRLDTPNEMRYFQHGGILQRVLRELRESRG